MADLGDRVTDIELEEQAEREKQLYLLEIQKLELEIQTTYQRLKETQSDSSSPSEA